MKLIDIKSEFTITASTSKLDFSTTGGGYWEQWDRFLSLGDENLFHLGNVCGTWEFFFRRVVTRKISSFEIEQIRSRLELGLKRIGNFQGAFYPLLPNGAYVAALFEIQPQLPGKSLTPDYFRNEQRLAWGGDEDDLISAEPYYRGSSIPLRAREMLFEFLIPLYDPIYLDRDRVKHYQNLIQSGQKPTAISLSLLDVKSSEQTMDTDGNELDPEFPIHWCFAHYLLDGHHKIFAAAQTGKPITILSFVCIDQSWTQIHELLKEYKSNFSNLG